MATSPLQTFRFRLVFAMGWVIWSLSHAFVLHWLGFAWPVDIEDSLVSNILLAGVCILITLILQFYIPQQNKYGYILGLCLVLAASWLFVSRSILIRLSHDATDYTGFFRQSVPLRLVIGFLIIGCMALVSVLWYTLQEQRETERRKAEAEKLSRETELYKLRQQLQPHFLFNSLNSINALIGGQPQLARLMIQQLSDFLRGTLRKEEHQWTSLEEELQQLQLYLDIEKVRFGHRLITLVHNDSQDCQLPAMLLQPVVENAIKFGLYDTTEAVTIRINAFREEGHLVIRVENPFDPQTSSPKKGMGFGLGSLQRRLYLLFARNDLLQTETRDSLFITSIKIPQ